MYKGLSAKKRPDPRLSIGLDDGCHSNNRTSSGISGDEGKTTLVWSSRSSRARMAETRVEHHTHTETYWN